MTTDARFSRNFSRKLTNLSLFTIRAVQHCAAISATPELLIKITVYVLIHTVGIHCMLLYMHNKIDGWISTLT